jgi:FkbM family methyltransferase
MTERVFVCVGPNRGDSEMLQLLQGHTRFFMFEPLPAAAAYLRQENAHLAAFFHVIEAACGHYTGKAKLTVYNENGVSSSLGKCTSQARQMYQGVDLLEKNQIEVDVINLCTFMQLAEVPKIETLMIDAQGMDLSILKTMRPYLEQQAIDRIIHEVDGEGFRHYDGLPDNSLAGAIDFMGQFPDYTLHFLPNRNEFNFDIEWRLASCCE